METAMIAHKESFWKLLNQSIHRLDTSEIKAPLVVGWYPTSSDSLTPTVTQETLEYEISVGAIVIGDAATHDVLILSIPPEGKKYSKRLGSKTSAQNRSNLRDTYPQGKLQNDFVSTILDLLSEDTDWYSQHQIVQMYSILVSLHRQVETLRGVAWPLECPRTKRNGMGCELGECAKCSNYAICGWRDPRISRLDAQKTTGSQLIEWV